MEVVEQHELVEHVQLVEHVEQLKRKQGRPPSVSHASAKDDEKKSTKKCKARKTPLIPVRVSQRLKTKNKKFL
jgi:hypothetical protein